MLAMCGHPYAIGLTNLFFNMRPLISLLSLSEIGLKEWSVVDVVVESDPLAPSSIEYMVGEQCVANYIPVIEKNPEYVFSPGELHHVSRLIIKLSGRFAVA